MSPRVLDQLTLCGGRFTKLARAAGLTALLVAIGPAASLAQFPKVPMVTIDSAFGGWARAQRTHFEDGAFFDRIYTPGR